MLLLTIIFLLLILFLFIVFVFVPAILSSILWLSLLLLFLLFTHLFYAGLISKQQLRWRHLSSCLIPHSWTSCWLDITEERRGLKVGLREQVPCWRVLLYMTIVIIWTQILRVWEPNGQMNAWVASRAKRGKLVVVFSILSHRLEVMLWFFTH